MNIEKYIREISDFPSKGIKFKDISPLLASPEAFSFVIDKMANYIEDGDIIVSPDARGFLLGTPLALKTKTPFVMVRKPGKLPGKTLAASYDLEYGKNELLMQIDALKPGDKVVIVDDILATGGTVNAIIELVEKMGASVRKIIFLAELEFLNGRDKLNFKDINSIITYD